MNSDQKTNIDNAVLALGESLASAWSYFYLLRGIDQGSRQNPEVVNRFEFLYDRAWRAIFDGFFAKVGTLLDNKRGTHYSLHNLVKLIKKYGNSDMRQLASEVDACLNEKDSSLAKLRNWRHSAVAHNTTNRQNPDFYTNNQMTLTEIEGALMQLEDLLNRLSWSLLAIHNDTRSGFESIVDDGKALFAYTSVGIKSIAKVESKEKSDPEPRNLA